MLAKGEHIFYSTVLLSTLHNGVEQPIKYKEFQSLNLAAKGLAGRLGYAAWRGRYNVSPLSP